MSNENNVGKHTPGPWSAAPQSDGSAMIAHEYETGNQMRPKGLRLVCHVLTRGNSLKQDEANARLIAAAPQLVAALAECEAYLEQREDVVDGDYGEPAPNREMTLLREVRAALTAAGVQS